jgi:hypothetical protein
MKSKVTSPNDLLPLVGGFAAARSRKFAAEQRFRERKSYRFLKIVRAFAFL